MKYGRFYEITNRNIIEEIRFCSKAIGDDETRYFLMVIHIEDSKIITTDGRRLHISDLGKIEIPDKGTVKPILPDGDYKLLKVSKKYVWLAKIEDSELQFPNWHRVMPNEKDAKEIIQHEQSMHDIGINYSELVHKCSEPIPINFYYIRDLGPGFFDVLCFDEHKAIMFKSGIRTAVIMPFQLDV